MSDSRLVPLVVGFILCATGSCAACPLELNPSSLVVKYGDSFSVNCSTLSETDNRTLNWEIPIGKAINISRYVTWTVVNVDIWDMSPICYIGDGYCEEKLNVTVYSPPNIVIISSPDGPAAFNEGEKYNLTCEVQNIAPVRNLNISWYQGDELVSTETFNRPDKRPFNETSTIQFTPTRHDDGTCLKCKAVWDLPEIPNTFISESYNITVHFGPEINCSEINVVEGESLEGFCSVTGNPFPHVTWLKSGKPWDPKVPVMREDNGHYDIRAVNDNVNSTKTIWVSVLYGPEIDCPKNYTAVEYTALNLSCIITGFPTPTVTWYKDREETYLAKNLTRSDAGQYTIIATNSHTNTSHSLDIDVLYPPSHIFELEDTDIDVGSSGGLKCSSDGNPRPQYSWLYYQADNVQVEHEDGVSRLQIDNATGVNVGSYTCHAWNERGNVSKTARVQVKGSKVECPVEITPKRMVVNYHDPIKSAICEPRKAVKNLYWKVHNGNIQGNKWSTSQDWNPRPECVAEFDGFGKCQKSLDFIMYRIPDKADLHPVDHAGPTLEKKEYQFQCDIFNVAPIHNLRVRWYLGKETIGKTAVLQTIGWTPQSSDSDISAIRTPMNVSSSINITLGRNHSSLELRCEAQLDLDLGAGQKPPTVSSRPHIITVYYKPVINTTILPTRIPVFRGYPVELKCEAEGHPSPTIHWLYSPEKVQNISGGILVVYEAGFYTCNATNNVDTTSVVVEVILKEDYLPLIAGFVAVTVVVISVIFIFIYSIYYKNTKMRRYSLKNPKLNSQNGNVAHNSWDTQLPMTKLS